MSWLYLHFPQLQLDLSNDGINDVNPYVVIDRKNNEVVQLNSTAKKIGIKKGMGLASSMALSSELKITEYEPKLEEKQLILIVNQLYLITADISLDPPQGLYLKMSSMRKLYSSANAYWKKITTTLSIYNHTINYALAHSASSAKLLALIGQNTLFTEKTDVLNRLKQLPVEVLQIDTKTKQSLERVGIKKIENLLNIPLKELAIRFDIKLINYIGQLKGELKEKLALFSTKPQFKHQLELLYEIDNSNFLSKPINKLLKQLENFLIKHCLTTQNIELSFTQADQEVFLLDVHSAQNQYLAKKWAYLISLKLENLVLTSPIRAITLNVKQLDNQRAKIHDMFSGQKNKLEPEELFSILQAKLGDTCVFKPHYRNEHLPELNSTLASAINTHTVPSPLIKGLRPAFLLPVPKPLKEKVYIQQSAERIQTAWWKNTSITRDYFIARNNQQQLMWVFREPSNMWFVHGYFG